MSFTRVAAAAFGALVCVFAMSSAQASVEINASPTKNMNCVPGLCTPTTKSAVLNTNDLANMLATGDVKVTAGNGAVTITVSAPFSWTSSHRLTLDANLNVSFRAPVEVAGTAAALSIITSDGDTGGDVLFFAGGKIDFWDLNSSLSINGQGYKLENDVKTLAADIIANDGEGYFALANDYDAKQDRTYKRSAIPTAFNGTFEGLGHTIANLKMRERPCTDLTIGMFSSIGGNGVVRDLNLKKVLASSGRPHWVGGLAGANSGLIFNVSASGHTSTVSGTVAQCPVQGYVGGLVGDNAGKIVFSRSTVSVSASYINHPYGSFVGGLAGISNYIDRSYATGDVSANSHTSPIIGGLAGSADNITKSFAIGAYGLIGQGGNIADSYAVTPQDKSKSPQGTCSGYNSFIGTDYGSVSSSYTNDGCFTANAQGGSNTDDYWDTTTGEEGCGGGDCTGITGLSDQKLKSRLPKGFSKSIWAQDPNINNGYPYLIDNPPPQ